MLGDRILQYFKRTLSELLLQHNGAAEPTRNVSPNPSARAETEAKRVARHSLVMVLGERLPSRKVGSLREARHFE